MSFTFSYIQYDKEAKDNQEILKAMFEAIENHVQNNLIPGRAKALVMTKLEEAYMWTGKAIRDDQIERHAKAALIPPCHVAERTNE